jgi:hypothetical protein
MVLIVAKQQQITLLCILLLSHLHLRVDLLYRQRLRTTLLEAVCVIYFQPYRSGVLTVLSTTAKALTALYTYYLRGSLSGRCCGPSEPVM